MQNSRSTREIACYSVLQHASVYKADVGESKRSN